MRKSIFNLKTKVLKPLIYRSFQTANKDFLSGNVKEINNERRDSLVKHAYQNSKFYSEKYSDYKNIVLGNVSEQFHLLPIVTREELSLNFDKFIVGDPKPRDVKKVSSSGSTGRPISVLHDLRLPYTILQWRILKWWGIEPYENQAFIFRYRKPFFKRLVNSLLWWPTKRIFLTGSEMNLDNVKKFARDINIIKPALLQGYVDVVFEFALFLLDNDIKIHPPRMVWVTSAPLLENQRKLMEKAFGAPVCDQYGNTEIFTIAAECPEQNGLHIMYDSVHVEVVDDDNNPLPIGETGRILITDLRNYVFPLIRYEVGDRGRLLNETCPCGNPLPLMDNVRGRQSVVIKTPSGLIIKSEHLAILFEKNMKIIREVQLVQNEDFSVDLLYVSDEDKCVQIELNAILDELRIKTRKELVFSAKRVHTIQTKKNKKPLLISHLKF